MKKPGAVRDADRIWACTPQNRTYRASENRHYGITGGISVPSTTGVVTSSSSSDVVGGITVP